VSEVLMNGLIAQSEWRRLLDELHDDLDEDPFQARWEIVNHRALDRDESDRSSTDRYALEPELV
jgi:hypothetical protein